MYEPILFGLIAYKAWPLESGGLRTPLVTRIARDSLLYFIVVFAELLISTVIWAQAPTYINIVMPWSAALPSLLGSRLLLNMREVVHAQGSNSYILEMFKFDHLAPVRNQSSEDGSEGRDLNTVHEGRCLAT